ncbi:MAG: Smr/MutS family protein [Thalassobaculales bacterium]
MAASGPRRGGPGGGGPGGEDDKAVWRAFLRGVTPLRPADRPVEPGAPAETLAALLDGEPTPPPRPQATAAAPPRLPQAVPPTRPGAGVPGLDRRSQERLRRGQYPIEGRLDLHGRTQASAHQSLIAFVHAAQARGARCVLVITGKGGDANGHSQSAGRGVLRGLVPRWLREAELRGAVLAFSPAQPKDGGDGALYLLLRRMREP